MNKFWAVVCCWLVLLAAITVTFMFLAYAHWIWGYMYPNNGWTHNGANTAMSEWLKLFYISVGGMIYSGVLIGLSAIVAFEILPEYRQEKLQRAKQKQIDHDRYIYELEREAARSISI